MSPKKRKRIGEILLDWGVIVEENIEEALEYAGNENVRIGEAIIALGLAEEDDITKALAVQYNMEYVDIDNIVFSSTDITLLPEDRIKRHLIIPLGKDKSGRLKVIITDPLDLESLDVLRFMLNEEPVPCLASKAKVQAYINTHIDSSLSVDKEVKNIEGMDEFSIDEDAEDAEGALDESSAPVIKLVSMLITEAVNMRASDIHVEPMADRVRVRYRIDGVCVERDNIPKRMQGPVVNRLKIMGKMDLAEKRLPLDGRLRISLGEEDIDFRASTVPSSHGESMVLRILRTATAKLSVMDLGFAEDDYKRFSRLIKKPNGVILVTGPTGSGKTTTLYAALNDLNRPDRKIITAEDPIEYNFTGINQCQVRETIGFTFANILRSMLRQAPNIILVGEIRDLEVAEVAIQAALTGHLVFSTLHTNDAPSALTRLINMGAKPFLVASSIQAIMAQRLVRVICSHCKEEDPDPNPTLIKLLGYSDEELGNTTFTTGRGCNFCNGTGYRGRQGIFELLELNNVIRQLCFDSAPVSELRKAALATGMKNLLADGKLKIQAGVTSLEEVSRLAQAEVMIQE